MKNSYTEPVSRLLTLGETEWDEWDEYSGFGFSSEHIDDLIRLGTDRFLLAAGEAVGDNEVWAPLHAWRALVQMYAVEAIAPLVQVLDWSEGTDSDLIREGLTDALKSFGAPVIETLAGFMNEPGHTISGYIGASEVMARIARDDPEHRDRVTGIITSALEAHYKRNDEDVNGFWIADLLDLYAVESYPTIKKAFEARKVNVRVVGDLEDVEIEFGMREKRDTPAPNKPLSPALLRSLLETDELMPVPGNFEIQHDIKKAKKEKNKRKAEKKSRKRNRKRK